MKKPYPFALFKGSKKFICPQCGKKRFVPYVYNDGTNRVIDADLFGRCDREQNCGYHLYPTKEKSVKIDYKPPKPRPATDYVSFDLVKQTTDPKFYKHNELFCALVSIYIFAPQTLAQTFEIYNVGTSKTGGAIFWQIDRLQRVRTGKIMQYDKTAHRKKDGTHNFDWVHKILERTDPEHKNFTLSQCPFGLHLVKKGCRVAVVESEKTAICMSIYDKKFVWVSVGGKGNLGKQLDLIAYAEPSEIVLFPDKGAETDWQTIADKKIARGFDFIKTDKLLQNVIFADVGADIWDVVGVTYERHPKPQKPHFFVVNYLDKHNKTN